MKIALRMVAIGAELIGVAAPMSARAAVTASQSHTLLSLAPASRTQVVSWHDRASGSVCGFHGGTREACYVTIVLKLAPAKRITAAEAMSRGAVIPASSGGTPYSYGWYYSSGTVSTCGSGGPGCNFASFWRSDATFHYLYNGSSVYQDGNYNPNPSCAYHDLTNGHTPGSNSYCYYWNNGGGNGYGYMNAGSNFSGEHYDSFGGYPFSGYQRLNVTDGGNTYITRNCNGSGC